MRKDLLRWMFRVASGGALSLASVVAGAAEPARSNSLPLLYGDSSPVISSFLVGDESAKLVRINSTGGEVGCDECNDGCRGGILDNTEIFVGGDAYQSVGDLEFGNNFGVRSGFNSGFGLGDSGIRGQFGVSYGLYDWKGDTFADEVHQQFFLTTGVYKRGDICNGDRISWALVFDEYVGENYGAAAESIQLGQLRGLIGYALSDVNEVGVWGAAGVQQASYFAGTAQLTPMDQVNFYWKHNWVYGAQTTAYLGAINRDDLGEWVFGLNFRAPMSDYVGVFGGFTYASPSAAPGFGGTVEEAWFVTAGISIFPGGKAASCSVQGPEGMPLIDVANNGSFLISSKPTP